MFYVRVFCTKFWRQKLQSWPLGIEILAPKILYKKRTHKMLMKLTPALSINNSLHKWLAVAKNNHHNSFRFCLNL